MKKPSFVEHFKKLEKDDFICLPNGINLSLTKTKYGTISCMSHREVQEQEFKNFFIRFFARMEGVPVTLDEISKFIELPGEDALEVIVDNENGSEIVARAEDAVQSALNYFAENINEMFAEALQRYMEETFIRALMHESADYVNKTEVDAFNYILRLHGESMRERMKIRKASGRKLKWSDEELQQILETYEWVLPLITEAKKFHKTIAGRRGWTAAVKALYPQLPINIIERFDHKGDSSAGALALSLAAEQFGKESSEYLRQRLIETRVAQKKNK